MLCIQEKERNRLVSVDETVFRLSRLMLIQSCAGLASMPSFAEDEE